MSRLPVSLKDYWSKRLVIPAICLAATLTLVITGFVVEASNSIQREALVSTSETLAHVLADPMILGEQLEILKRVSLVSRNQGLSVSVRDAHDTVLVNYPAGEEVRDGNNAIAIPVRNAAGVQIGRILARRSRRQPIFTVVLVSGILSLIVLFCSAYWLLKSTKPILIDIFSIQLRVDDANAKSEPSFRFLEVAEVQSTLLSQAKRLIELERQKSRFILARQVAHDIRSPLSAVSVVADVADGLAPEHRALLRAAVTQIEKTSFDILEQEASSQIAVVSPPTTVSNVHSIQDVLSLVREVVCIKKLELCRREGLVIEERCKIHEGDAQLQCEPTKLFRVLSNLLNNAVEALSEAAGKVIVQITEAASEIVISIEDNGIGMTREVQTAALISGGTFGKSSGHGLGLSNAKQVVEGWGGTLKISSTVGVGTRVSLHLPALS